MPRDSLNSPLPSKRAPASPPPWHQWRIRIGYGALGACIGLLRPASAWANPDGPTVLNGTATIHTEGPNLTVEASHNTLLQWPTFNIREGESATFIQPSRASIVWNKILDQNPSQILGSLHSNGYVVLMNEHGFYFGPKSVIQVGGLVVSTVPLSPADSMSGGLWQFRGTPPAADIVHYGQITTGSGGAVYLIAEKIENHGVITAPDGTIGLYSGKEVLVSERPDGRGLSASVRLPSGSIDNQGKLVADAGAIALQARVVNQDGLIQADSVREHNGTVELFASDALHLTGSSVIQARGDTQYESPGGQVTLRSDRVLQDEPGSNVHVEGGGPGGRGGQVEFSAPELAGIQSSVNAAAQPGWNGGQLVIDPTDILLNTTGAGTAGNGTVEVGTPPTTLRLNVNSAFVGFSQILLQASQDIQLSTATVWDLAQSTGRSEPGCQLTLQAGRNIVFGNNARLQGASGWSVRLVAGADFAATESVRPGIGGIYLNGNANGTGNGTGALETTDGSIRMSAGREVIVGSGYIRTTAKGNIDITAVSGSVNAGTRSDGYQFSRFGYAVGSTGVGGIATQAGGDVRIDAGGDISSILPTIGAYGEAPGQVTLHAGQRILGNYLVRNGTGSLRAGTDIGSEASPVTLSLVSGRWDARAANDLYLNEVRNPNGALNGNRLITGARIPNQFDYALDAAVHLEAGHAVALVGNNLARATSNPDMQPVYPPILEILAGSGGITLGNNLVLYPSSMGKLQVETTAGGSFRSTPGNFFQMAMSDSGDPSYRTFDAGHASVPLHQDGSAAAVHFDLSGGIQNIFLRVPMRAEINVGGDTVNFGFEGQNLDPSDVTTVHLDGDYLTRGNRTTVVLTADPHFDALDPLVSLRPELAARLAYDPASKQLTFQGRMQESERDFLISPLIYVYDAQGLNPVPTPAQFTVDAPAIRQLFLDSQSVPTSGLANAGLQVGGPGNFVFEARRAGLGSSAGIRSIGAQRNEALLPFATQGADLRVQLGGDLDMTSSQIASLAGGSIHLESAGQLNVGSQEQLTSDDTPKGIYTAAGGNVDVQAHGNINVNGSRIAAFDGGDVRVASTGGDVNAGAGGLSVLVVNRTVVDPADPSKVTSVPFHLSISGIAATSFPNSGHPLGNLTIEAAGSILANFGGVRQAAFGGSSGSAIVRLKAGLDILAGLSGIIGENIVLDAGRRIEGLVVAKQNLNIESRQGVNVLAVAGGAASVSSGGDVAGRIASGTSISVDASSVSGSLIAHNVSTGSADASTASVGVQATSTARSEKLAAETPEAAANSRRSTDEEEEEARKRKAQNPLSSRTSGRVTIILPKPTPKP